MGHLMLKAIWNKMPDIKFKCVLVCYGVVESPGFLLLFFIRKNEKNKDKF